MVTKLRFSIAVFFALMVTGVCLISASAQHLPVQYHGDYDMEFFSAGKYLQDIPTPESILGYKVGSRPATHAEIRSYFRALAEASDRVILRSHGVTYEGRELIHAIITAPANHTELRQIKSRNQKLADPSLAAPNEASRITQSNPVVFWAGYNIHGDELSGADAAMQVAYQLAAGTDTMTLAILDDVVAIIDPMENPDGRDRFLAMMQVLNTAVPTPDAQSLQHRGVWPYGRSNHYWFDLNRDWYALVHPETQGRVETIIDWNPQVIVDAHEMGVHSSFLFSPPRAPYHPTVTENRKKWWDIFARDQGAAFDEYGWRYYSGDWNEEWFPGFTTSWGGLTGAVGILYEQARVEGKLSKQPDKYTLTYGETVHHQFVSSIANLRTAAFHRERLLRDFHADKLAATRARPGAYLIIPGDNPGIVNTLIRTMQTQGIQVMQAKHSFAATGRNYWNASETSRRFPEKTIVVTKNQPMGNLVETILSFDHRLSDSILAEERKSILRGEGGTMYEITAWCPLMGYGLTAYDFEGNLSVALEAAEPIDIPAGRLIGEDASQGYAMRTLADHEIRALVELFREEINLRAARKPFSLGDQKFPAGSVVISRKGNPDNLNDILRPIAETTGANFYAVPTGQATTGYDLGSGKYDLLARPRIAMVATSPASYTTAGAIWHMLDQRLQIEHSLLDATRLGDLSKYNVLILPSSWRGPGGYLRTFGEGDIKTIKDWVADGGTLIATGSAAAFCADTSVGLSQVRQRRQALNMLDSFEKAVADEKEAKSPMVSDMVLWKRPPGTRQSESAAPSPPVNMQELAEEDSDARRFRPHGTIVRVDLDTEEWLTFGMEDKVPALMSSSYALLSKPPVRTVGRYGAEQTIRLSGLLWPEARERWAETAYLTRESRGKGQVILIAERPVFRGYFHGTERLLINAILFGPGLGSREALPW